MSCDLWDFVKDLPGVDESAPSRPTEWERNRAITKRWFEVVDRIKELEQPGYRFRRMMRGIFVRDQLPIGRELEWLRREREQLRRMLNDPDGWWREEG